MSFAHDPTHEAKKNIDRKLDLKPNNVNARLLSRMSHKFGTAALIRSMRPLNAVTFQIEVTKIVSY